MEEEVYIKIKNIRKQKKMTLKNMSEETGFSISFLSQMERGVSPITMTSLKKISSALDIQIRDLFAEPEMKEEFVRRDSDIELQGFQRNYKHFSILSGRFDNRKMDIFNLVMEPNSIEFEESSHDGEEFYYVVKGSAIFTIEGLEHRINAGETIHFPSYKKHQVQNREETILEMICALNPPIF
ncbi:MAG: helix-turn-helix domain-containing protein [Lachnotalea sp.]